MGEVIVLSEFVSREKRSTDQCIDIASLKQNSIRLRSGLIAPPKEEFKQELAPEHTSEPIKNLDDINRISEYLIKNGRFRDNMLFIVGINFGLRVGDLRMLRFSNLINSNLTFKESFPVFEQKTRNTRLKKKNRYITINRAVVEAVTLYLENTPGVSLSDFLFVNESYNRAKEEGPLSRKSIDRILKGIANDLGLRVKMSTHTLRKTFAYHQMVMSNNDPRKLLLLSKILGHSSVAITLDYIGITSEEIAEAYRQLNLGSRNGSYLIDGAIGEADSAVC